MAKLTKVNTGNQDNSFVGCAITGSCDSAASAYVKTVELSDGDVVSDGMIVVITFSNGNTAGNAPGTKTIYSSDQINYYEDVGLTVPFTLAPDGCYDLEYTGTGNAYTYQSYPVLSIGDVTGPVCDYRGHKASGSLWEGGDEVQCMYKNGKFLLLGGSSSATGAPVGTIIAQYKKAALSGFLYCDGRDTTGTQEELATHYPALYMYLGSNVLPDYRECAMVGAEQNTTDTIATHDTYTAGQFKDDQLQTHKHSYSRMQGGSPRFVNITSVTDYFFYQAEQNYSTGDNTGRSGDVTRGKRKAVFFYIKATSGLSEDQQENVLATINQNNSYSTTEQATGAKWVDGKPIYRRVLTGTITSTSFNVTLDIQNIAHICKYEAQACSDNPLRVYPSFCLPSGYYFASFIASGMIEFRSHNDYVGKDYQIIIEYTKSTD